MPQDEGAKDCLLHLQGAGAEVTVCRPAQADAGVAVKVGHQAQVWVCAAMVDHPGQADADEGAKDCLLHPQGEGGEVKADHQGQAWVCAATVDHPGQADAEATDCLLRPQGAGAEVTDYLLHPQGEGAAAKVYRLHQALGGEAAVRLQTQQVLAMASHLKKQPIPPVLKSLSLAAKCHLHLKCSYDWKRTSRMPPF